MITPQVEEKLGLDAGISVVLKITWIQSIVDFQTFTASTLQESIQKTTN